MSVFEHYERHAETCLRLAHAHAEEKWADGLLVLAEEYRLKAHRDEGRTDESHGDGVTVQNGDRNAIATAA